MRTIYMKERRMPTYDDLEKYYKVKLTPSFEFDHQSPSRGKYRTHNGIRAYESGYFEVEPWVHRNPDMRHTLAQRYGLVFLLPKTCYRVKFFTPDNMPVAASAITTRMLFLDGQTRRAYSYERHWADKKYVDEQARIDFAAHGAVPMSHALVRADLPNKDRVKDVLREYKEFFKACATTALLMKDTYFELDTRVHAHTVLEMMLRGEEVDLAVVPIHSQVRIGQYVAGEKEIGIRRKLTELSIKNFAFPYLKIVCGDDNG